MKRFPSAGLIPSGLPKNALQAFVNRIARIEQREQPESFSHIHPHAHATARLARLFAEHCGCGGKSGHPRLEEVESGAWAHDIGKYYIDPCVLLKPGKLDEDEEAVMRLHPRFGAIIISRLPGMTSTIREIVLHHHEHWDGSGYPDGLKGQDIPLVARIISVVDVYTALRSRRSYKPTRTKAEAIRTLSMMAGRELDPNLVEDFLWMIGD